MSHLPLTHQCPQQTGAAWQERVRWSLKFDNLETSKAISGTNLWQCTLMVLSHWETKLLIPLPDITLSHIIQTLSQPVLALF